MSKQAMQNSDYSAGGRGQRSSGVAEVATARRICTAAWKAPTPSARIRPVHLVHHGRERATLWADFEMVESGTDCYQTRDA